MTLFGKKKKKNTEERQQNGLQGVSVMPQSSGTIFGGYGSPLLNIPSVFASVQIIGNTIASLPLDVFVENIIEKNHPAAKMLDEPIENMTQSVWVQTIIRNYLIDGNAFASTDAGKMTIYESNQVVVNMTSSGSIVSYTIATDSGSSKIINPADMLHFKRLTRDGKGQLGLALIELFNLLFDEMQSTSQHTSEYMKNGLLNGLWIEVAGRVQPKALEEMREKFAEIYSGLRNRNKIPTFTDGMKLHTIDNKALKDSDIAGLRAAQLKDIAMIFNIPISLLDGSQGNYASTVEANLMFMKTCINPIIKHLEDEINQKLNVLNGIEFRFDTSKFLAGTFSQQIDTLGAAVDKGILTPNEARARIGYDKADSGGDTLYAPAGTPTSQPTPAKA